MHEQLFKKLTSTVYTVQDFHSVLGILGSFFDSYFFKEHKEMSLHKAFTSFIEGSEEAKDIGDVWGNIDTDFLDAFTKENNNDVLQALESIAEHTPHAVLYVPVLFPYEEVKKLSQWMRKNVVTEILIDVKVDALAVGGCNFVWNGVYYDYSMQYFIGKKRSDMREMLRTFKQ